MQTRPSYAGLAAAAAKVVAFIEHNIVISNRILYEHGADCSLCDIKLCCSSAR